MASVIVFDANDPLLYRPGPDEPFERVFGSRSVRRWGFMQIAQFAFGGAVPRPRRS